MPNTYIGRTTNKYELLLEAKAVLIWRQIFEVVVKTSGWRLWDLLLFSRRPRFNSGISEGRHDWLETSEISFRVPSPKISYVIDCWPYTRATLGSQLYLISCLSCKDSFQNICDNKPNLRVFGKEKIGLWNKWFIFAIFLHCTLNQWLSINFLP